MSSTCRYGLECKYFRKELSEADFFIIIILVNRLLLTNCQKIKMTPFKRSQFYMLNILSFFGTMWYPNGNQIIITVQKYDVYVFKCCVAYIFSMFGCQVLVSCILNLELGFCLKMELCFCAGVKHNFNRAFMNRMGTSDTAFES